MYHQYEKPTRKWLVYLLCIVTFPLSAFVYIGLKTAEGTNYRLGLRQTYAKLVNLIAGGTMVEVPVYINQRYHGNAGYYSRNPQEPPTREEFGEEGEKKVRFAIEFLERFANYKIFNHFRLQADNGFYQEVDHLVIGENGIFNLETKTHTGEIFIQPDGSWVRKGYGGRPEQLDNPASQIDRHELIIKNVLNNRYPVFSIISLGNNDVKEVFIHSKENSRYPIIHHKDLTSFIKNSNTGVRISPEEVSQIAAQIRNHIRRDY